MSKKTISDELFSLKDEGYKKFQCALMPTVNPFSANMTVRICKFLEMYKIILNYGQSPVVQDCGFTLSPR